MTSAPVKPSTATASAPTDDAALQRDCLLLQEECKTLLLSTLKNQQPDISYTPFVRLDDGCFYIFISALAAHTQQLLSHAQCAVMLIRDEAQSRNLFARERLIFQCQAECIARSDAAKWVEPMAAFEARQGSTVALLKSLSDFELFRLKPEQGRYVVGFGKAYDLDPATQEFVHVDADKLKQQ